MTPEEFLTQKLEAAEARFERETRTQCNYDRDAVRWLDRHLRELRALPAEQLAELASELGAFFGQCFVVSLQGQWARINQGGLSVKLGDNVYVVPWDKVEGYLNGDDGDSPIGFFDCVARDYAGKQFDSPKFLF